MENDSLALAEMLFSLWGIWHLCYLMSRFLTSELPAVRNPPSCCCRELRKLRELGYSLEICTDTCIRTILVYPLADPAHSFVLVLPAWERKD